MEGKFIADQPEVEGNAVRLYGQSPVQAREYLTGYSAAQADLTLTRWKKLGEFMIWKYLDGNLHMEKGPSAKREHPRYPDGWYRRIVQEKGDSIKMPKEETAH